jgi:hypothetical protein
MIVPGGGGISLDGSRWVSCRPGFFLPVRVLSRLFRRLFLEKLVATHAAGRLQFFGQHARRSPMHRPSRRIWRAAQDRVGRVNGCQNPRKDGGMVGADAAAGRA